MEVKKKSARKKDITCNPLVPTLDHLGLESCCDKLGRLIRIGGLTGNQRRNRRGIPVGKDNN